MIPTEKTDIERFTPESLANLVSPPVFLLRPATGREMRTYRRLMQVEGLVYHSKEEMRAEVLRALKELWSPDAYATEAARLQSFWAMVDQEIETDKAEAAAVDELVGRLTRVSRPLRQMMVDNAEFGERSLDLALSMFLCGWSGFDCPYRMEGGLTPLDVIDAAKEHLVKVEEEAEANKVEGVTPGLAYFQLCLAAQAHLGLTKAEEKNSDSPPSTLPSPSSSTTTPSGKTAGASSKASASTSSTKRTASAKQSRGLARKSGSSRPAAKASAG